MAVIQDKIIETFQKDESISFVAVGVCALLVLYAVDKVGDITDKIMERDYNLSIDINAKTINLTKQMSVA